MELILWIFFIFLSFYAGIHLIAKEALCFVGKLSIITHFWNFDLYIWFEITNITHWNYWKSKYYLHDLDQLNCYSHTKTPQWTPNMFWSQARLLGETHHRLGRKREWCIFQDSRIFSFRDSEHEKKQCLLYLLAQPRLRRHSERARKRRVVFFLWANGAPAQKNLETRKEGQKIT